MISFFSKHREDARRARDLIVLDVIHASEQAKIISFPRMVEERIHRILHERNALFTGEIQFSQNLLFCKRMHPPFRGVVRVKRKRILLESTALLVGDFLERSNSVSVGGTQGSVIGYVVRIHG